MVRSFNLDDTVPTLPSRLNEQCFFGQVVRQVAPPCGSLCVALTGSPIEMNVNLEW